MIPNNTAVITREGSLGGEIVEMRLDDAAQVVLMDILTNLYPNPQYAVIRETSTNALDAHREAGQTRPIEVTLPNAMSPFFRVKDYGTGMSTQTIKDVYAAYGASTKRENNDDNGMFGLGAKAPLTYTNQFTVIAVKDGVMTEMSISRVESGKAVIEIIAVIDTDEPNGVEVVIPARDYIAFEREARTFFSYWFPGQVLINGEAPEFIMETAVKIDEGLYLLDDGKGPNYRRDKDYVVMGNVPYPVTNGLYDTYRPFSLIKFVPMGAVAIVPSRESLMESELTRSYIQGLRAPVKAALTKYVDEDIAGAKDYSEALEKGYAWRERLSSIVPSYKGENIPFYWTLDNAMSYNPGTYRNQVSAISRVSYPSIKRVLFITGFDGYFTWRPDPDATHKVTPSIKKKIAKYVEDKGLAVNAYVLVKDRPTDKWLQDIHTVSFEDIQAVKLPPKPRGPKGPKVYHQINSYGYTTEIPSLDTTKPIIWYGRQGLRKAGNLTAHIGDATLVALYKNEVAKFQRDFPKAMHYNDYAKARFVAAEAALTDLDKIKLGVGFTDRNVLRFLDPTKIDDPEVGKFIEALGDKNTSATMTEYSNAKALYVSARYSAPDIRVDSPLSKYPLARHATHENISHVYTYMNAIYKENKNV